jgi:diguanylate cyclase (GGDEF)-like protein
MAALLVGLLCAGWTIHRLRGRLADALYAACHDPLTALPNRLGAQQLFASRTAARLATVVALLDLDRFKQVNDTHGHHAGDQLLTITAARLTNLTAIHGGTAYRLSGDEFLLLIPHPGGDPAEPVAGLLTRLATPARIHPLNNTPVMLIPQASAGIAHFDGYNATSTELLHHADTALYHAKHSDQRWVLHHHGMQPPHRTSSRRSQRLRHHFPPRTGDQGAQE